MEFVERDGKMVLRDFDPSEALMLAMYVEAEGARFYRELSRRTKEKKILNELQYLLEEEESHSQTFKGLLISLSGGVPEIPEEDIVASLTGIFGPIRKLRTEDILCDNAEALRLGATVKKRMISFFKSLLEETSNSEARRVLEDIIKQEERHLAKLKLLLAY
jgi:rubrerythrin